MKRIRYGMIAKSAIVVCSCALVFIGAFAKDREKGKDAGTQRVDSGAFGVFTSGARVATETFSVEQSAEGSTISSQFKSAQGEQSAEQSSELHLTPSAELRRYEWKEVVPEKLTAVVVPSDAFLIERYGTAENKMQEQNFLLPASTLILDDYFFVQREVLAWKYLALACKKQNGNLNCPHQKVQFGTLNPHARSSMPVTIEFSGREKLTLHGTERELSRFVLTSDAGNWAFWLDDQLKLVRLVNDSGTEIVRD